MKIKKRMLFSGVISLVLYVVAKLLVTWLAQHGIHHDAYTLMIGFTFGMAWFMITELL